MVQRYRIQKQLFPYASSRKLIDNGRLEIETVRSTAFFTGPSQASFICVFCLITLLVVMIVGNCS